MDFAIPERTRQIVEHVRGIVRHEVMPLESELGGSFAAIGPLLRAEIRSCFAMTEPDRPGSNPTWMDTRAVLEGGEWAIDGHKWFTSGADGATFAIVMAVTNPEAAPHMRASQILVPCDTPGF